MEAELQIPACEIKMYFAAVLLMSAWFVEFSAKILTFLCAFYHFLGNLILQKTQIHKMKLLEVVNFTLIITISFPLLQN